MSPNSFLHRPQRNTVTNAVYRTNTIPKRPPYHPPVPSRTPTPASYHPRRSCAPFSSSDTDRSYRFPPPQADTRFRAGNQTSMGQLQGIRLSLMDGEQLQLSSSTASRIAMIFPPDAECVELVEGAGRGYGYGAGDVSRTEACVGWRKGVSCRHRVLPGKGPRCLS